METLKIVMILANSFLVAGLGFYFNRRFAHFSNDMKRAEEYRAERIQYLKSKLQLFLDPVLQAIEIDNITWERIQSLSDDKDVFSKKLSVAVEHDFLMENHKKAAECVQKNLHFLALDHPLRKTLIEYVKHVAVYAALRKTGEDLNPIDVNVEFPDQLESLLRIEFEQAQAAYDRIFVEPQGGSLSRS